VTVRWYSLLLLLLLVVFQGQLWFSSGGVLDLLHTKKKLALVAQEITEIREKNRVLTADTKDLQRGDRAIEERAREVLGMVKEREVFYQFVDSKAVSPCSSRGAC
jgi:cell division protein FtsB